MSWWAIDVRTTLEERDSVGVWLVTRTGQAVEERDDGTLVAFAPDEAAAESLIAELNHRTESPLETRRRSVEAADWSTEWRRGLTARRVGRLRLVPSWLAEESDTGALTIVLDPETAFGSGEHGSTRAALRLMEKLLVSGDRVVDLGSGSGILTIAAAKLGAAAVIGIEVDPEANPVAIRNAARNQVADRVEFLEGDAATLAPLVGPAQLLVSNILRTTNTALLPAITAALCPGGIAIFSGMEQPEADDFRGTLDRSGFNPFQETSDSGWWAVAAERPE
jgi:ribosomal protein L11 methyltransferase